MCVLARHTLSNFEFIVMSSFILIPFVSTSALVSLWESLLFDLKMKKNKKFFITFYCRYISFVNLSISNVFIIRFIIKINCIAIGLCHFQNNIAKNIGWFNWNKWNHIDWLIDVGLIKFKFNHCVWTSQNQEIAKKQFHKMLWIFLIYCMNFKLPPIKSENSQAYLNIKC